MNNLLWLLTALNAIMVHQIGATLVLLQVVASDIGATVLSITESNVRQYLLELMYAVVAGQLPASKFIVGLKASGVSMEAQTPNMLVQLLWCAPVPHQYNWQTRLGLACALVVR